MKSSRRVFLSSYLSAFSLLIAALPSRVRAQATAWTGACVGGPDKDVATIQGLECLMANVLGVALTIIGITAFVMFLVGSFRYLTSGSNSKGVESGKYSFTYAILGIVVALASFLILRFISQFTGVTSILQFSTQVPKTP